MHGYGIAQRIHQSADDLLKIEDGSLYPALYRMEERGWISSEWGVSENNRRAKFYKLTRAGRKHLDVGTRQLGPHLSRGYEDSANCLTRTTDERL